MDSNIVPSWWPNAYNVAHRAGLEEVQEEDVPNLLGVPAKQLIAEDRVKLGQQHCCQEEEAIPLIKGAYEISPPRNPNIEVTGMSSVCNLLSFTKLTAGKEESVPTKDTDAYFSKTTTNPD